MRLHLKAYIPEINKTVDVMGYNPINNSVYLSTVHLYGTEGNDILMYCGDEPEDVRLRVGTGLKDKNGVEIYEGDVVNILHPAWIERCEVIFDRGSFTLRQIRPDVKGSHTFVRMSAVELWPENSNWKLEVIGNIHENPELLEEKK